MSLTVYESLEQGSPEWLQARCGILTASTMHDLITAGGKVADNLGSRGLAMTLAVERITAEVEYVHPSFDMQRGTDSEPYARELYAEHHAPVVEVGFMLRHFDGFSIGYSPDGTVNGTGLIEIKARKAKIQMQTILAGTVPTENVTQVQVGLLVSGREWLDFISYSEGLPLHVIRVYPDVAMHAVILEAAAKFETDVTDIINTYMAATAGLPIAPRIEDAPEIELKL